MSALSLRLLRGARPGPFTVQAGPVRGTTTALGPEGQEKGTGTTVTRSENGAERAPVLTAPPDADGRRATRHLSLTSKGHALTPGGAPAVFQHGERHREAPGSSPGQGSTVRGSRRKGLRPPRLVSSALSSLLARAHSPLPCRHFPFQRGQPAFPEPRPPGRRVSRLALAPSRTFYASELISKACGKERGSGEDPRSQAGGANRSPKC